MILKDYLKKIGVKEFSELTQEEKDTYRVWEETLSGRKITDEEVSDFFTNELEDVMGKITSMKLSDKEDTFLKMKLEFLRKIQNFLQGPELEKKMLEQNLHNQLKS